MTRRHSPSSGHRLLGSLTRRQLLQVGGLSLAGLSLPDLLASESATKPRAKACILLFMWGGPSHLDTWDMKPEAPDEIRGEFKPIPTTVTGLTISEHFPRLAQQAQRYSVIRSLAHDDPAHLSSVHYLMTGRLAPTPKSDAEPPSRKDTPHIGSMLNHLHPVRQALPSFVTIPWIVSHPAAPGGMAPGQNGGWLGSGFDPFVVKGNLQSHSLDLQGLVPSADLSTERLGDRQRLLSQLSEESLPGGLHERAFSLLTSPSAQRAFDLSRESERVRDHYGRHLHGQCCLMARRLIEAGVRLVCINWPDDGKAFWDTHADNFNSLKTRLMPPADHGFAALLEDLDQRGLLDETLVVWVGEFGRKPTITRNNAGREHWPGCYSAVVAGGGIRGGQVLGSSDRTGSEPDQHPLSPADLTATMYHALGVDPETVVRDRQNRPLTLTEGTPIRELF